MLEDLHSVDLCPKVDSITVNSSSDADFLQVLPRSQPESLSSLKSVPIHTLLSPTSCLAPQVCISYRDPVALDKAGECLAFLVRDPAHIMPDNFEVRLNFPFEIILLICAF
ncbi:unnamed protein product [Protopolystoma xenopodis]|uniref:Uncharacterized protein n=1 Tax=Protopolystoma xenopodis TaxID=117903 RepID=A0A3S5BL28_9PLAT|nr:unnamed protein product [Protopolystoma xenopodis]